MSKYDELTKAQHEAIQSSEWKYIRETSETDCTTPLYEYVEAIYPGCRYICDMPLPKDLQTKLGATKPWRFRPDLFLPDLLLDIEFDGPQHYTSLKQVLSDKQRDAWMQSLGIRTIRVPYWLQLSRANIETWFGVDVGHPMCETTGNGLMDTNDGLHGLTITPYAFCIAGVQRFMDELSRLPEQARQSVLDDIQQIYEANNVHHDLMDMIAREA